MQTPPGTAGELTERIMAALIRADVLKADALDYPTHYNRAFSAVHEAIIAQADAVIERQRPAAVPAALMDKRAAKNLDYLSKRGLAKAPPG